MLVEISGLLAIHIAAASVWIGLLAAILLLPRDRGFALTAGRFGRVALIAMPVTLLAGWALAFLANGAPGQWPWAVDAMQTAGLAMAGILLVAQFGALLLLREAGSEPESIEAPMKRYVRLIAVGLVLGLVVLGFAVSGRYG